MFILLITTCITEKRIVKLKIIRCIYLDSTINAKIYNFTAEETKPRHYLSWDYFQVALVIYFNERLAL